jgi:hypothetical protein
MEQSEKVTAEHHDRFMIYLSSTFGRTRYVRDEIECLLCEGHPGRNLSCCDWFRQGMDIFDCTDGGRILHRSYGKDSTWVEMPLTGQWTYRFLNNGQIHYEVDPSLSPYALAFGQDLRSSSDRITFTGRKTKTGTKTGTSYVNPFMRSTNGKDSLRIHHFRAANFYSMEEAKSKGITKMIILGDAEKAQDLQVHCNPFDNWTSGKELVDLLEARLHSDKILKPEQRLGAGCYHQQLSETQAFIEIFPPDSYNWPNSYCCMPS